MPALRIFLRILVMMVLYFVLGKIPQLPNGGRLPPVAKSFDDHPRFIIVSEQGIDSFERFAVDQQLGCIDCRG